MGRSSMFMLDPMGKARATGGRLANRQDDVRGLTVGIINNGWWSMGVVANRYQQLLQERFGIREVIHYRKAASSPSPAELIEEIAANCQVVIAGLGN